MFYFILFIYLFFFKGGGGGRSGGPDFPANCERERARESDEVARERRPPARSSPVTDSGADPPSAAPPSRPLIICFKWASLMAMQETQEMQVQSLGWEDPLKKEMATNSSILAWKIPRTEKPGGLQSTGLQRVGHGHD